MSFVEGTPSDLIGTAAAGKLLGVSGSCVARWILSGRLRGWRVGGRFRVSRREVLEMCRLVQPAEPIRTRAEDVEAARQAMRRMGWA